MCTPECDTSNMPLFIWRSYSTSIDYSEGFEIPTYIARGNIGFFNDNKNKDAQKQRRKKKSSFLIIYH